MDKEKEIEEITKCIGAVILKNTSRATPAREMAAELYKAGYRLCGGDNCPNFKHYEAECRKCTDKQEFITALQIESAKEQAVREFAEKLRYQMELNGYRSNLHNRIIDNLITELYGEDGNK